MLLLALIGDTLLLLLPAVIAELSAGPSAPVLFDMDVVNRCLLTIERDCDGCCCSSSSDGAPLLPLPVDIDDEGMPAAMTVFFIDDSDGFFDGE